MHFSQSPRYPGHGNLQLAARRRILSYNVLLQLSSAALPVLDHKHLDQYSMSIYMLMVEPISQNRLSLELRLVLAPWFPQFKKPPLNYTCNCTTYHEQIQTFRKGEAKFLIKTS